MQTPHDESGPSTTVGMVYSDASTLKHAPFFDTFGNIIDFVELGIEFEALHNKVDAAKVEKKN